jgi:phage baseplate assembly protein W
MIGMNRYTGERLAGADHLGQSIDDILGTPVGTRCGRRDYGSEVPKLIDQPNNELGRVRIIAAAAQALLRQEGRARLSRIVLSPGQLPHSAVLTIAGRRTDVAGAPAFTHSSTIRASSALA